MCLKKLHFENVNQGWGEEKKHPEASINYNTNKFEALFFFLQTVLWEILRAYIYNI